MSMQAAQVYMGNTELFSMQMKGCGGTWGGGIMAITWSTLILTRIAVHACYI